MINRFIIATSKNHLCIYSWYERQYYALVCRNNRLTDYEAESGLTCRNESKTCYDKHWNNSSLPTRCKETQ